MSLITLDGRTLEEFGLIVQPGHEHSILPETVERTKAIPGRHGLWDFGSTMGARYFSIPLAFPRELTRNSLQQKARKFAAFLLDGLGRPREIKMIFDYESDVFYTVKYAGSMIPERLFSMGFFSLPLVAYDPHAYLIENTIDINVDSDILVDSDMLLDSQYSFQIPGPTTVKIDNFGALNVRPIIQVTGSFNSISFTLADKILTYNSPVNNQTLILNFADYTAKIGSVNVLGNIYGDFFDVQKGVNAVQIGGNALNCTVEFIFRTKYL